MRTWIAMGMVVALVFTSHFAFAGKHHQKNSHGNKVVRFKPGADVNNTEFTRVNNVPAIQGTVGPAPVVNAIMTRQ